MQIYLRLVSLSAWLSLRQTGLQTILAELVHALSRRETGLAANQ